MYLLSLSSYETFLNKNIREREREEFYFWKLSTTNLISVVDERNMYRALAESY
jgi:hypothetical protein